MKRFGSDSRALAVAVVLLVAGCATAPAPVPPGAAEPPAVGVDADSVAEASPGAPDGVAEAGSGRLSYAASGPATIDLARVPVGGSRPVSDRDEDASRGRIESPLPDAVMDQLRRLAELQAPSAAVQTIGPPGPAVRAPTAGVAFDSLDVTDCCGGGASAPPDNELAVGPNHVIAAVNVAFAVYDKAGNPLPAAAGGPTGPRTFSDFFGAADKPTPFTCAGPFDPNVLYDEAADRFILGVDSSGSGYCVAVSKTGDPTGEWWAYQFATDIGGAFFDFPHAGVGQDAVFMGSNQFSATGEFLEGRVFAWDKATMYAGASPLVVRTHSTGADSTPQPVHLHGWAQGSWPAAGPHYVLTETFDGSNHSVWSWEFATDTFVKLTPDLDLATATGVPCPGGACMPIDAPQLDPPPPGHPGAAGMLQANDYRGLDAEYRNGSIWTTQSVSCNPGGGVVDCVRWAEIDPTGPAIVQAGVFASQGEYRLFPDTAANHCGDMAVGYTKTSTAVHPGVFVTGRQSDDAAGTLQVGEQSLKDGEGVYSSSIAQDQPPHRWGDYSGMTVAPDGFTFWYLGEYSKDISASATWGTHVGSFSYPCPVVVAAPAALDFGALLQGASSSAREIILANDGNAANTFTAMSLSDAANFALDVGGGGNPCSSTVATLGAGDSCSVAVTFQPTGVGPFAATLTLESPNPANTRVVPLAGEGVTCTAPATVDLETPDPVMDYEACVQILAGPWVVDQSITLRAGESVVLRGGLVIDAGVEATLANGPP